MVKGPSDISSRKYKGENLMAVISMLPLNKPAVEFSSQRIKFKDGWYDPETSRGDSWRWTKGKAIIELENLNSDAVLFIKGWSDPKYYEGKQWITLKMGNFTQRAEADGEGQILQKFEIPIGAFCEGLKSELEIVVEKPFIPAESGKSEDYRTLGFMLRQIYYGPKGP